MVDLPPGSIIMWCGDINKIPNDWKLCNGENGTPDLTGKFIVGYDSRDNDYNEIRKQGGKKTHMLTIEEMPLHDHELEGDGSHTHNFIDEYFEQKTDQSDQGGRGGFIGYAKSKNSVTQSSGHSHKIKFHGGTKEHENRPPYFVLAFIMKII